MSVQGVAIREDAGTRRTPLDLLPTEQRSERELSSERLVQRIVVGTVLAAALRGTRVSRLPEARDLHRTQSPREPGAPGGREATDGIARELERQVADYNYLLARKHGTLPVLAFIEEVSKLLPDNTWVQQLDVKTTGKWREVTISGETASASKLIEILEGSTLLQNAAFRGNMSRGTQTGTERFLISAEVRPRAQPESRPVLEMVERDSRAAAKAETAGGAAGRFGAIRRSCTVHEPAPSHGQPSLPARRGAMSAIALPRAGSDRSRSLAVALLVALVVLAVAIIAVPFWLLHRHYDLAIADSLEQARPLYRASRARAPSSRRSSMRCVARTRGVSILRSGAAALSAAEAQEAVRSLVESSGGRLITMQAPVSKDDGHYRQMTANVQLTANIFALRKILHAIENNVPYLFVDNLTIRTQVPGNFKPAPGGEPEMFVQFDVSGYSLTGAP